DGQVVTSIRIDVQPGHARPQLTQGAREQGLTLVIAQDALVVVMSDALADIFKVRILYWPGPAPVAARLGFLDHISDARSHRLQHRLASAPPFHLNDHAV